MEAKYKVGQIVKAPVTKSVGGSYFLSLINSEYLTIVEIMKNEDTTKSIKDDGYIYYFKELDGKGGFSSVDIDKTNNNILNNNYPIY